MIQVAAVHTCHASVRVAGLLERIISQVAELLLLVEDQATGARAAQDVLLAPEFNAYLVIAIGQFVKPKAVRAGLVAVGGGLVTLKVVT